VSDKSLYVADELMDHWPYLRASERELNPPCEQIDNFFLALNARHPGPVLTWKGSPRYPCGSWRA
jgi:hypothetical protein